jgi:hypothetical protein
MRYITHDTHLLCSTQRDREREKKQTTRNVIEEWREREKYENEKEKSMKKKREGGGGGYQASKPRVN